MGFPCLSPASKQAAKRRKDQQPGADMANEFGAEREVPNGEDDGSEEEVRPTTPRGVCTKRGEGARRGAGRRQAEHRDE
eukprot:6181235-Pleurochrysis_carterae.AAC.1